MTAEKNRFLSAGSQVIGALKEQNVVTTRKPTRKGLQNPENFVRN